jgi:hypothetical protein
VSTMFRAVTSSAARRTAQKLSSSSSRGLPGCAVPRVEFHASAKREEDAKATPAPVEEKKGFWDPSYSIPLGIALAVPVLKYEWYIVNEETQLAACMMAFSLIVYKQFGGVIYEALEQDGKRILAEHNAVEDEDIAALEFKINDVKAQSQIVQDAEDIKALKIQTYQKLNEVGKIKPQYEFKSQIEKLLSLMATEEANMTEKAKAALMLEATDAVKADFATSKELKKSSLQGAIATLKGAADKSDPVKDAYLKFFRAKAKSTVDEKAEAAAAREQMITKLNAVARSEGFFFEFDASGKPKMIV